MKLRVLIEKDEDGFFIAECPTLPGCISQGETREEAIKNIKEAIDVFKKETKKEYHYIVVEDNKQIIGLVTWQMHGLPKHQLCELDRIAVLPEARGKGVAQELVNALINDASKEYKKYGFKLRKVHLLTHADNIRAQEFYKKVGFTHEAALKEHFYKGKDELVMSMFFA